MFLSYKESFTRLRSLKTEIEHLQHLLEKSKVQMQKDFELWWSSRSAQQNESKVNDRPHSLSNLPDNQNLARSNDLRSSRSNNDSKQTSLQSFKGADHIWRNPSEIERKDQRHGSTKKKDVRGVYEDAKRTK